jgi:hypothetical protein
VSWKSLKILAAWVVVYTSGAGLVEIIAESLPAHVTILS